MAADSIRRALVLTGGVAKGAFEAGAVARLVEAGIEFDRIVGTSAGALTGLLLAHGIAGGAPVAAAETACRLWNDEATLFHFVRPSWRDLVRLVAISSTDRVVDILAARTPVLAAPAKPVEFVAVATDAQGFLQRLPGKVDQWIAAFETAFRFGAADLCDLSALRVARLAAAASAALPGLFEPVAMPPGYERFVVAEGDDARKRSGTYYDGGLRNNNPLSYALRAGAIDQVVVVSAFPLEHAFDRPPAGLFDVGGRVFEILVNGGIANDIAFASETNRRLALFERFAIDLARDRPAEAPALLSRVRAIADLEGKRPIEIVPVCPDAELPGNVFTAFLRRDLRRLYIERGREVAAAHLPAIERAATR